VCIKDGSAASKIRKTSPKQVKHKRVLQSAKAVVSSANIGRCMYSKTGVAMSKITNKPNGLCDQENWWCRK